MVMVMVMMMVILLNKDGQRWDVLTTIKVLTPATLVQGCWSWNQVPWKQWQWVKDILPRCPASAGCSEVSSTICFPIHRTAQGQSQPIPISKYMYQYQYQYKISRYTIIISIKTANMNIYTWPLYRFSLATCFCAIGSSSSRHLPNTISHG